MDGVVIRQAFEPLWDDILEEDQFYVQKPLLAHYTSIPVIESILRKEELWFSNPLFMNDIAEIRFGIFEAVPLILNDERIKSACRTEKLFTDFKDHFNYFHNLFANEQVLDIYIFCLSEHDKQSIDGSLSMWRGYGSNGNGAAIVFDSSNITPVADSPLIISKVKYIGHADLISFLDILIKKFAKILSELQLDGTQLGIAAFELFERVKLFSLFTKHKGFQEEKEWRIAYIKDRDINNRAVSMIDYWIGKSGIEPKLKLKVQPIEGVVPQDLSLAKIIDRIILGPSVSSLISREMVLRMLDKLGKSELKEKVCISTIPFRAK